MPCLALPNCRQRKAPLSVDGAQKLIERLGKTAKLAFPPVTPWRPVKSIRTLQAFMGHRSIANTVVYAAGADKRIRNIWGKVMMRAIAGLIQGLNAGGLDGSGLAGTTPRINTDS